jgi:hypothetical protein
MRRVAALLVALVGAGTLASQASAAIVLAFDRQTAHPGQRVSVYTALGPGQPNRLFPITGQRRLGITVYLVPLAQARVGPYGRPPRRWIRVGELVRDRGVGRLTFVVPRIRPGRYTTAVWCRPCGGGHGTFFIAGALLGSPAFYRASALRIVLP